MSAQNAIQEHLSEKMTISFWLWNYFYGIKKGEFFHDLEQCFVELRNAASIPSASITYKLKRCDQR